MKLFEPTRIGGLSLPNRVVITSHAGFPGLYDSEPQSDAYAEYLERRAAGGVGLLILQCVFPPLVGVDPPAPVAALQDRLARFAGIVHGHGGRVLVQIAHPGAQARGIAQPDLRPLRGLSALPSTGCLDEVVHELDEEEIAALLAGFELMAGVAVAAGLDGVELHGGHGYLLHQSMSPWMNQREDGWGAELALVTAALAAARRGAGPDKLVGLRFPSADHRSVARGGHTEAELAALAVTITDASGLDFINATEGSDLTHYGRSVGTYRRPHGDFLPGTAAIRTALDGRVPVIGVGRITSIADAEQALEAELCDLIGLTRAHIADPDILKKAAAGQSARVRPCVGANQGCIDRAHEGFTMTCFVNPEVGREERLAPIGAASSRKRVVVVGGGPAGLKAAEIAARRGHEVSLLERADTLGGRLASITSASSARELLGSIGWITSELAELGVPIRLGVDVDEAVLSELAPDVTILATGSLAVDPGWLTDGSVARLAPEDGLREAAAGRLANVVVYDALGNDEAAVTYEQLAALGARVWIVTPSPGIGAALGHTHASDHIDRLLELGCTVLERSEISAIADGAVTVVNRVRATSEKVACDGVVVVSHRRPDTSLRAAARRVSGSVQIIGDAYAPRTAMHAIRLGYDAGRAL